MSCILTVFPLVFRPATDADYDHLLALRRATMQAHLIAAGVGHDDEALRTRLSYHWEDAKVIVRDGIDVGLLKAYRDDAGWFVVQIQIAPDFQRQGLGEQALQTILDDADAQGLPVSLAVLKANPAKRLYDRLGFAVVSETDIEFLMTRPGRSG